MKYTKGTFYGHFKKKESKAEDAPFVSFCKKIKGWIIEDLGVALNKQDGLWRCTDIKSGYLIHIDTTKKDCAEWVEKNWSLVEKIRRMDKYSEVCEQLENLVKEKKYE